MSEEKGKYSSAIPTTLKIRGVSDLKAIKKKKKKKHKSKTQELSVKESKSLDDKQLDYIEERFILDNLGDNRTAAEKKYEEIRQQREEERLKKRAALTHKQKVEKLNEYLASLSEHYDVPKVSWTK